LYLCLIALPLALKKYSVFSFLKISFISKMLVLLVKIKPFKNDLRSCASKVFSSSPSWRFHKSWKQKHRCSKIKISTITNHIRREKNNPHKQKKRMKLIKIKPLKKLGNDLCPSAGKIQTFSYQGTHASPIFFYL